MLTVVVGAVTVRVHTTFASRHREHRFPGRRRPVQVRFDEEDNQAVAALNATGETPEWLAQAVQLTTRAVRRVDEAAEQLMRRLP